MSRQEQQQRQGKAARNPQQPQGQKFQMTHLGGNGGGNGNTHGNGVANGTAGSGVPVAKQQVENGNDSVPAAVTGGGAAVIAMALSNKDGNDVETAQ
jgi:hypothetical protein